MGDMLGIDHVQLAMPVGGEETARTFYVGTLGFEEEPKPPALAKRGGAWFRAGAVKIHLGAESDFRAAKKAHPAILVRGLRAFVETRQLSVRWDDEIEGVTRCHTEDPFGNRIELIDS